MSSSRLVLLAAVLAGCASRGTEPASTKAGGFFGARAPASRPVPALSPETGARLFASLCSTCHGSEGRADTPLAGDLSPVPADFSRCNFKYRSTPSGALPRREDLERTVAVGIAGSAMPSFGSLVPEPALAALAREVEARCDRFAEEVLEEPLAISAPPLYDAASVGRGRAVFARERCASCHGEAGRGDGRVASQLRDNRGRPVRPRDYTRGLYRSGFGRRDIYRAFSTGLDGTPMPALPPGVSTADRWDLTHYLVSLSADRCKAARLLESTPTWFEPARTWGLPWR
jgi:mono/diheme cytochrome c family protein